MITTPTKTYSNGQWILFVHTGALDALTEALGEYDIRFKTITGESPSLITAEPVDPHLMATLVVKTSIRYVRFQWQETEKVDGPAEGMTCESRSDRAINFDGKNPFMEISRAFNTLTGKVLTEVFLPKV